MARNAINWPAIRKLFEQTDTPVMVLSMDYSVSRRAIDKRADKEKWTINPAREELKARRAGGSLAGDSSQPETTTPRGEISPTAWRRARELYEGTRMPMHGITEQTGISETDIDFKIAEQGWSRFGSSHVAAARSAEWRDGVMRDAATGEPAPAGPSAASAEPIERMVVDPDPARVRSPIRRLSRRDEKPIDLSSARKVKPDALVAILRDAGEALCCQIRDAIGNRDTLMDMIEEWNEDNPDDPRRSDKYEGMKKALDLKELSLTLKNTANALKSLLDQDQGAAAGKKERQNERAKQIAEGEGGEAPSPFQKRRPPPRLAAAAGERVP